MVEPSPQIDILLRAIEPFTVLVESEIARLTRDETNLHAITVCLVTQKYDLAYEHKKFVYATELGHVTIGDLLLLQTLYRQAVSVSHPGDQRTNE